MKNDTSISLIKYLKEHGFADKNFMVSPLSLKTAICLAIEGANGETKQKLLKSIGFSNYNSMKNWYDNTQKSLRSFLEFVIDKENKMIKDCEYFKEHNPEYYEEKMREINEIISTYDYLLANSIWANKTHNMEFSQKYVETVNTKFNATAHTSSANTIDKDVTEWVEKKTKGSIKNFNMQLSCSPLALINTIYLKSFWCNKFAIDNTRTEFHAKDGSITKKTYLTKKAKYIYNKNNDVEFVIVPLEGNIKVVYAIGSENEIFEKINTVTKSNKYTADVALTVPEIDIDSAFVNEEFINYFKNIGCELPFSDSADFSLMTPKRAAIDEICQFTHIKTNKDGLEAAAVTVLAMRMGAIMKEDKDYIDFTIDSPFSFYILDGNNEDEVMFYGQIIK